MLPPETIRVVKEALVPPPDGSTTFFSQECQHAAKLRMPPEKAMANRGGLLFLWYGGAAPHESVGSSRQLSSNAASRRTVSR